MTASVLHVKQTEGLSFSSLVLLQWSKSRFTVADVTEQQEPQGKCVPTLKNEIVESWFLLAET